MTGKIGEVDDSHGESSRNRLGEVGVQERREGSFRCKNRYKRLVERSLKKEKRNQQSSSIYLIPIHSSRSSINLRRRPKAQSSRCLIPPLIHIRATQSDLSDVTLCPPLKSNSCETMTMVCVWWTNAANRVQKKRKEYGSRIVDNRGGLFLGSN